MSVGGNADGWPALRVESIFLKFLKSAKCWVRLGSSALALSASALDSGKIPAQRLDVGNAAKYLVRLHSSAVRVVDPHWEILLPFFIISCIEKPNNRSNLIPGVF